MKDLKLENLSPEEYSELRRLVNNAKSATQRRYKCAESCREAHARLATKRAELLTSEQEEEQALARLNRFLAAHRKKPQTQPKPNNRQVASQWASRCQADAAKEGERARKERFTKLG